MSGTEFPTLENPLIVKTLLTLYDTYCSESIFSDLKESPLELREGRVNSIIYVRMLGEEKTINELLKVVNKDPEARQLIDQEFHLGLNGQDIKPKHFEMMFKTKTGEFTLEPALERCRNLSITSPFSSKAIRDALRLSFHYNRDKLAWVTSSNLWEEPATQYLRRPEITLLDLFGQITPVDKRTLAKVYLKEDRELALEDLPKVLPLATSRADLARRLAQINMGWRDNFVGQCVNYAEATRPKEIVAVNRDPIGSAASHYGHFRDQLFRIFDQLAPAPGSNVYYSTLYLIFGQDAECGLIARVLPALDINVGNEIYPGTKEHNFALAISQLVKDPVRRPQLLDTLSHHPEQLKSLLEAELTGPPVPQDEPILAAPLEEACHISHDPKSGPEDLRRAVDLAAREIESNLGVNEKVHGLLCRGQSHERLGDQERALADYNAALNEFTGVDETYVAGLFGDLMTEAYAERGRFFLAAGKIDLALADLAKALEQAEEAPLFLKQWLAQWLAVDPRFSIKDPDFVNSKIQAFGQKIASFESNDASPMAEVAFNREAKENLALAAIFFSLDQALMPRLGRLLILRQLARLAEMFADAQLETLISFGQDYSRDLRMLVDLGLRQELDLWLNQVNNMEDPEKNRLADEVLADLKPEETEAFAAIFLSFKSSVIPEDKEQDILAAIKEYAKELAGQPVEKQRQFGKQLAREIGTATTDKLADLSALAQKALDTIEHPAQ